MPKHKITLEFTTDDEYYIDNLRSDALYGVKAINIHTQLGKAYYVTDGNPQLAHITFKHKIVDAPRPISSAMSKAYQDLYSGKASKELEQQIKHYLQRMGFRTDEMAVQIPLSAITLAIECVVNDLEGQACLE